jgi:CubicO group peptidase (beta-lactamase class C family)
MAMIGDVTTLPMERIAPEAAGLDPERIERLYALIRSHIDGGRYLGAQIAFARDERLAVFESFGLARLDPEPVPAGPETMWLLFSQTKPVIAATIWSLVEQGSCRFADRIAEHVPGFERNAKGEITLWQVLTHQGGFPNATVPEAVWADHELLRRSVCDFALEWTPGERVQYHSSSGHWVLATLIEALTGRDYRTVVRERILIRWDWTACRSAFPQVFTPASHTSTSCARAATSRHPTATVLPIGRPACPAAEAMPLRPA